MTSIPTIFLTWVAKSNVIEPGPQPMSRTVWDGNRYGRRYPHEFKADLAAC